jgi:hypothetical protein
MTGCADPGRSRQCAGERALVAAAAAGYGAADPPWREIG